MTEWHSVKQFNHLSSASKWHSASVSNGIFLFLAITCILLGSQPAKIRVILREKLTFRSMRLHCILLTFNLFVSSRSIAFDGYQAIAGLHARILYRLASLSQGNHDGTDSLSVVAHMLEYSRVCCQLFTESTWLKLKLTWTGSWCFFLNFFPGQIYSRTFCIWRISQETHPG